MKKTCIKLLVAAGFVCLLAACDTKTCYCYEYTHSRGVIEGVEYIDADKKCQSLSKGRAGEYGSRACVERNERLNPNEMAWK